MTKYGFLAFALYIGTIFAANWAIQRFGFVSVGFGLVAPAGVYFAGLAFSARDGVQEELGRRWVVVAILLGAFLSWFVSPSFAVASGVAFLVSETVDFCIYTPLRHRNRYVAVALSNTIGAVVDSFLFLWLAFGSIAFWKGQVVGKWWTILPALIVLWLLRNRGHYRCSLGRHDEDWVTLGHVRCRRCGDEWDDNAYMRFS